MYTFIIFLKQDFVIDGPKNIHNSFFQKSQKELLYIISLKSYNLHGVARND